MACTSGSVWASRHTLPAPCRQQHRYLTQHVSSLSLSLSLSISGVQSATISGCARLLLLTKSISERQLCLSWCLQSRDKSAPSPSRSTSKSISKDRGGSGWVGGGDYLGCWWYLSPSSPFRLRCTAGGEGGGADLSLRPKGCLVHHLCWPRTQSHTLVSLNKLVCQSVAMSFKRS